VLAGNVYRIATENDEFAVFGDIKTLRFASAYPRTRAPVKTDRPEICKAAVGLTDRVQYYPFLAAEYEILAVGGLL
jgi:hypothetical protein